MYLGQHSAFGNAVQVLGYPAWVKQVEHFHIPKHLGKQKNSSRNIWVTDKQARLLPVDMNPGFIDTNGKLIVGTRLDQKLKNLINNKTSIFAGFERKGGKLAVALVDLTGGRLAFPEFAGYRSTGYLHPASCAKVATLYTAFQLRFDLRAIAISKAAVSVADLLAEAERNWKANGLNSGQMPRVKQLFDLVEERGKPLKITFKQDIIRTMCGICHNWQANKLIRLLSPPFISSVLVQSGLHHPKRGGLWLGRQYSGQSAWKPDPVHRKYISGTALSLATFFTLMAQRRLVDEQSSVAMQGLLKIGNLKCYDCKSFLEEELKQRGLFTALDRIASKIGLTKMSYHDCALIERKQSGKTLRYAIAILTRSGTDEQVRVLGQLILACDKLIQQNNP